MTQNYLIDKIRYGRDGELDPWSYMARVENLKSAKFRQEFEVTNLHSSIDDLAKELASFPGIGEAIFDESPDPIRWLGFSDNGKRITQGGVITDDELGELGLAVQKYLGIGKSSD